MTHESLIALMMEAANTAESSVNYYQTTRRIIPKDSHLQERLTEGFKPNFCITLLI
jgi:hypothetical protein